MKLRPHIPNLLTIGNLICGSIVVVFVAQGTYYSPVVFLLFLAGFFDLLDGAIARALKVSGDLGKQLDSLADVISFGLAPSVIVYNILETCLPFDMQWIKFFAFVNVACAAIRLARFNISTDQTTDFSGMPSPANGLFWGSISMLMWSVHRSGNLPDEKSLVAFTLILLAITSFLMIAPVRMFSFKFQKGGFAQNKIPYIYICLIILLPVVILALGQPFLSAVPLAIMLYMALSFVYHFGQKQSV